MRKFTKIHRENLSKARKGIYCDEKHPQWKGENASYRAVHQWVVRKLGTPGVCEGCGRTGLKGHDIHWASRSGECLRLFYDWVRLCAKCHKIKDVSGKKYNKLTKKYV